MRLTEYKRNFIVEHPDEAILLLGVAERHVTLIEEGLAVELFTRGEQIIVTSEKEKAVDDTIALFEQLIRVMRKGIMIDMRDIVSAIEMTKQGEVDNISILYSEPIAHTTKGKTIRAKTIGQRRYVQAVKKHDLVFGIGPAGTGKTYLAVVLATQALKNGHVKRIILTRPAVEAGESLGFLPGDLKEKVDPYLRPLYDALHDVLGASQTERMIERGIIEIAPLAYMRGRTLDDAFVILDEAQNTTRAQMKMFLTRLGFGSKMIITGDKTQIDLPHGVFSGLKEAEQTLQNVKEIAFCYLETGDVIRHPLVARIIEAYADEEKPEKR